MQRMLSGAAAGLIATVPMTAVMKAGQHLLPAGQQSPLPPRRVTMRALRKIGAEPSSALDEGGRRAATLAAHYAYGTAAGALFGLIAPRRIPEAISAGVGYGLLVWAASYLGLLPALGLHPSASREPAGRNLTMIAAHVAWGAALGASAAGLRQGQRARR